MNDAVSSETKPSLAARILVNAMSGAGSRIATMAIGFLLTPLIITELGLSQYGLWSVLGMLSSYLGLLDFGVGGAFVKFIAEYVELDDRASARQVFVFGIVFYAAFGLIIAAPVFFFAPQIVHVFKMPPDQYVLGTSVLRVVFAMIIVFMIVNVPGMVVVAMQRMDLASRNFFFAYLAYASTTVVFLKLGYGIWAIIIGQGAMLSVIAILHVVTASRLFGSLWHNPFAIDRKIVARMFSFGGWAQLTSILNAVNQDVGRFVGAGFVGTASVAIYDVANKPAFFARIFPAYLLDALMPPLVSADTRKDELAVDRLYAAGTRVSTFLALALAGAAIGGAEPLIRVWLGQSYPLVSSIVFWIASGFAVSALAGVGTTLFRASGEPKYETYYMAAATAVTVAATLLLVRPFGIVGVAMGSAVGWLVSTVGFVIVFHRVRPFAWWSRIGSPASRSLLATAVATYALYWFVHVPIVAHFFAYRLIGLIVFAGSIVGYVTLLLALTTAIGVWSQDREQIASRFNAIRARLFPSASPARGGSA